MKHLRAFFSDHRRFAALLIALALCMKLLVPTGYMIGKQARVLTVEICADASGDHSFRQIVIPQHDTPGESHGEHGEANSACPYMALSMASLAEVDAPLLALALAFIIALGFVSAPPAHQRRLLYLHPPLRGPPAFI